MERVLIVHSLNPIYIIKRSKNELQMQNICSLLRFEFSIKEGTKKHSLRISSISKDRL